jgi:histidyl-tRNA synthetase
VISQYRNDLTFPYKRYQIQPVWRADKPQKGRYREFTQCDIDIVGAAGPMADAQILTTVAQFFDQIGLEYELQMTAPSHRNDYKLESTTYGFLGHPND